MLKILIVEDDSQLATTLKYLVEDNPRYRVVAIADDADNAVAAAEYHNPDLALVDLHLARGSTGFSVAVRLSDFEVPCLFVSGKAPSFPMPDLALGCLMKPFTAEEVHRALTSPRTSFAGARPFGPGFRKLQIYDEPETVGAGEAGFIPSRPSLRDAHRTLDRRAAEQGRLKTGQAKRRK